MPAERATTWYWAFNLWNEPEFTRDALLVALERFVAASTRSRVAGSSLRADVSCFLRTYLTGKRGVNATVEETLDCPLTTLGLLADVGNEGRYRFHTGNKPGLTPPVFCYALLDCWEKRHAAQETLSLREIVHGEGSPGRIFRLDEDATLAFLDTLANHTDGQLIFNDTAMVRQVARRGPVNKLEILHAYYNDRN